MAERSVKGSLILGVVVAVRRLRDRGQIAAEVLEARLSKEALSLLDEKIAIATWYPVEIFTELLELDWEISGGRDPAYLERLGGLTAAKMFDSQRYQQLEYAERRRSAETRDSLLRQARLINTVTGTLYDFLDVDVEIVDEFLEITYSNVAALGDAVLHTTVGFMTEINERQGNARRWTGERISPDTIRFRMPLPSRLTAES